MFGDQIFVDVGGSTMGQETPRLRLLPEQKVVDGFHKIAFQVPVAGGSIGTESQVATVTSPIGWRWRRGFSILGLKRLGGEPMM